MQRGEIHSFKEEDNLSSSLSVLDINARESLRRRQFSVPFASTPNIPNISPLRFLCASLHLESYWSALISSPRRTTNCFSEQRSVKATLLEVFRSLFYHRVDLISCRRERSVSVDNDDWLRDTTETEWNDRSIDSEKKRSSYFCSNVFERRWTHQRKTNEKNFLKRPK